MTDKEWLKIIRIFTPHAQKRYNRLSSKNTPFAYYTSAETAFDMIGNKTFWLRHTSVMNDFREGEHGKDCLRKSLFESKCGNDLHASIKKFSPQIAFGWQEFLEDILDKECDKNYIMSLSEHGGKGSTKLESQIGRLSMWRAYGGGTNVAMVFRNDHFLDTKYTGLYLSPVLYGNADVVTREMSLVARSIRENVQFLKGIDHQLVHHALKQMIEAAVSSIKHPGFAEEREWRLIYKDDPEWNNEINSTLKVRDGIPQRIFTVPLTIRDEYGTVMQDLFEESLQEIIIGPTQYPRVIEEALRERLHAHGVRNTRITVSDIPLRR